MVINPSFKFKHFTTVKSLGDMKDVAVRNAFLSSLKIKPKALVLAKQIHSDKIKIVSSKDGGEILEGCDGLITDEKNLALGIFTADCMPILMCSKDGRVKAAIHSGWKGLAAGILENASGIFNEKFKTGAKDICVYIAPHIKECCYEVGKEFEDIFGVKLKNSKLNMAEIAIAKLKKSGVKNITIGHDCTFCGGDKFFSYRKNKTAQRQLTVLF